MKTAIKQALTDTIKETNLSKDDLNKLLIEIDKHAITGFGTQESVNSLFEYVYKNNQDEIIDFVTLLHINLTHYEVESDYITKLLEHTNDIVNDDSKLDPQLKKLLKSETTNDLFIALLFLIKINISVCIIENNKKEK